jgi:hypothetical protein
MNRRIFVSRTLSGGSAAAAAIIGGTRVAEAAGRGIESHAMSRVMIDLLAAGGPGREYERELMLYGQLVGSWDIESEWFAPDGTIRGRGKGEWHFGWILGGMGVQDVLFRAGADASQYGTSLRCYDPKSGIWHIAWMQPASGEFVHLIGKRDGRRILQEGTGTDPKRQERWTFNDITANRFRWLGEVSFDEGLTWIKEQQMIGTRRK